MINKNLMLVAMLSMGTALTTLGKVKPALASLTPPATYDYSYTWNAAASEQYLNVNGVDSIPLYTRIADGAYYNYTSTFQVIEGLDVTMTFNRSNTTWQASGTSWKPDQDNIGSDGTVGTIEKKVGVYFNNQTNKNYYLSLDFSSNANTTNNTYILKINSYNEIDDGSSVYNIRNKFLLTTFVLHAYTTFDLYSFSQSTGIKFDAWYLEDLGISDAYQAGYDANRTGILTDYLGTDAQQIGWVLLGIAAILFVFKGGK